MTNEQGNTFDENGIGTLVKLTVPQFVLYICHCHGIKLQLLH